MYLLMEVLAEKWPRGQAGRPPRIWQRRKSRRPGLGRVFFTFASATSSLRGTNQGDDSSHWGRYGADGEGIAPISTAELTVSA